MMDFARYELDAARGGPASGVTENGRQARATRPPTALVLGLLGVSGAKRVVVCQSRPSSLCLEVRSQAAAQAVDVVKYKVPVPLRV